MSYLCVLFLFQVSFRMFFSTFRVLFSLSPSPQDLDDIEDENEQLKQENKTLLKVVGQLTR